MNWFGYGRALGGWEGGGDGLQGGAEGDSDGGPRLRHEQGHADVDRSGHLPGVGEHRLEPPAELQGHLGGVKAQVGFRLVQDDGDVGLGHAEALRRRQEGAEIDEARPIRSRQDEKVVRGVEGCGEQIAETGGGVDHDPGAAGPQGVQNPNDVPGSDGVRLGRAPRRRQHGEPIGVREEVFVEVLAEVVALGLGPQRVGDRQVGTESQGGRDLAELKVEVQQHDRSIGRANQELGGIGGHERLAAPSRRRSDGDDASAAGWRGRKTEPAPGDAGRPCQGSAHLPVVGRE